MTTPEYTMAEQALMESESPKNAGRRPGIFRNLEVTTLLRLCGSGFTLSAILLFLFQRWEDASDLLRYGLIFGETLALTALGLLSSLWLKDQKSARVFLSLSLVSTSAVFTILAAMIYSRVQWMPVSASLPDYAVWALDSMVNLAWLLTGSLVILGGQSLLSLSVLARPVARRLLLLLLVNTLLLLLPVRDMGIVTLLVLPPLLGGGHYLTRLRQTHTAMRTTEGTMAGLLVMLPILIMIGRSACFYAEGAVALGSLAMIVYLTLRQLALSITQAVRFRKPLELASLLPAAVASYELSEVLLSTAPGLQQWQVLVLGFALSVFLLDLATRAAANRDRYLQAVFYTGLIVSVLEEVFYPGMATATLGFVLSGLSLLFGYSAKAQNLLRISLLVLIGSLVLLVSEIVVTLNAGTWMSLAILGMATIISAAAVERYGKKLAQAVQRLK